MTRVTTTDVEDIAEFGDVTGSDLQPFIDDAHVIVNERAQDNLSDAMLPQVEKWLAAHLAAMKEKRVSSEAVGQGEVNYEGRTGLGLKNTRYGQQLLVMVPESVLMATPGSHYTRTVNQGE